MTILASPPVALLLRTTLLLGLALLAVRLLRGPAVQTLAGRAALAAVALLLLTAPLPRLLPPQWHVPAPAAPRPAAPAPVVTLMPSAPPPQFWGAGRGAEKRAETELASTVPTLPPPPAMPSAPPSQTPPLLGAGGLLLLLWATGTALLLLWLAVCQGHLTRLHRRAVRLTDGPAFDILTALTPNPPRLYTCPGIDGPFLAGLVRPAIYLPADHAETFSPDALRAVLAHELAHAGRHDTRWTLASRLLCALLWPQPLLWLLCRKLDHLSEDACDLAVLSHACPPRVYADCLLTLAERRPQSRRTSPLTAGLVPFRSQLARRVQHILAIQGNPPMPAVTCRLRFALPAAAVLVALGGTLLIAAPAPSKSALWQSVSADPQSPLVGVWLFKGQPLSGGRDALLVYRADGQEEFIASGKGGHDAQHYHFTYRVNGNQLTEQMKDQGTNDSPTVLHFDISKDMLIIHDAIEDSTGERVADAAQASLVEKMLTAKDAQPAAVLMDGRSALAPPAPSKSAKQESVSSGISPFYVPPSTHSKPKMQKMIGYGLRFTTADTTEGKETCSAFPNSPAARTGIPVTSWSEIIAINSQPVPASSLELVRMMKSGPPLRLTLKTSGKATRTYILHKKSAFSIPVFSPPSKAELLKSDEIFRQAAAGLTQGLATRRQSLARYEAQFQAEMHQALPGSDSTSLAKAVSLERSIGTVNVTTQSLKESLTRHPESKDTPNLLLKSQAELVPLLAQERRLFPAVPETQQHLARIHTLAVQCRIREVEVDTYTRQMLFFKLSPKVRIIPTH